MKTFLLVLFLVPMVFNLGSAQAQILEFNAWNNLEGKLGDNEFQMSLYPFKTGEIKGNYIVKYTGTKISLRGSLKGNEIFLKELIKDTIIRNFKGRIFKDSVSKFSGIWTDSNRDQSLAFSLRLNSITSSTYDHRYANMFGTTEEIEGFVKKVITAILGNNREWVGAHTRYPQRRLTGKGFNSITGKQQLIREFEQIFTHSYKDKIRQAYTSNLFCKNGAVMVGDGALWISNTVNSTKDKYGFEIMTINP